MKMLIHSLPLGAAFGAVKIAVSPVKLYTKQHCSQTLLYQALQAWWNENETNRTNHRRLALRKVGVWKNESLSESFGSRWTSKVKINAYYKTMKMFFDIACMSTCCWGLPKPKYEPFITHNRGTLSPHVPWWDQDQKNIVLDSRSMAIFSWSWFYWLNTLLVSVLTQMSCSCLQHCL